MSELKYVPFDPARHGDAYVRAMSLAYGGDTDDARSWKKTVPNECLRVVEQDGRFAATLALFPFGHWFGGRSVTARGVAGVGTTPEARGRGAGTMLMQDAVREMHADGIALSTLYPAVKAVYRRAGYEEAGVKCVVEATLAHVRVRDREATMRAATADDHAAIEALEATRARLHDGNVDRSPLMWARVRKSEKRETHTQVVLEDGRPTGYVQYRMASTKDGMLLPCQDMVATTRSAARRLLTFVADHGMQFGKARWLGHPADDLVTASEALAWSVRVADIWMARVTHVANAIAERGYPRGARGDVHIEVTDDVCPGNAGRWIVRVEDGRGEATRGGDGSVQLDVRALAALYTGFAPARVLRSQSRLCGSDDAVATLDALFAGPTPWMQDEF